MVAKSKAKTINSNGITYADLRRYNLIAAFLHAVQGVLVLVFSKPGNSQPITTSFLTKDQLASQAAGHPVTVAASHHLFDLNLAYIVAAFFFITAAAHLIIATWKRRVYEYDLKRGVNRARWIEYAFTLSIMMAGVALLSGVFDLASLLMIVALMAVMSLLGMNMELRNQGLKQVDWASYSLGVAAGIVPWIVLLIYELSAHNYGNGIPGFVYWIYASMLVLFATIALNFYLQFKRLGKWSTYLYGERAYIIISFVAKAALAWQVFAGTLHK